MSALLALALLAAPVRAQVIHIDLGAMPVGPTRAVAPQSAGASAGAGLLSLPVTTLRAGLSESASPRVSPGLEAVQIEVMPEAAAPAAAPASAPSASPAPAAPSAATTQAASGAGRARAFIPGAETAEGFGLAVPRRDRREGASDGLETAAGESARPGRERASGLPDSAASAPERAAALGRRLFDLAAQDGRAPTPVIHSLLFSVGAFGGAAGRAGPRWFAGADAGGARPADAASGEPPRADAGLRDAVAGTAPGAGAALQPSGPWRALTGPAAPAEASGAGGAAPLAWPPRPLALDLSGAGLVLRLRAALAPSPLAASAAAGSAARPAAGPAAGPSTLWLERGALLESFAAAETIASRAGAGGGAFSAGPAPSPASAGLSRADASSVRSSDWRTPAPAPAPLSPPLALWWLVALPLTAAAWRAWA